MLPVAFTANAFADDGPAPVALHAEVRPRFEMHTGRDGGPGGEACFVTQRSRFGVHADLPRLAVRATFQDVRTWGSEASTLLDFTGDTMDLHEGWLQWRPAEAFTLKAGRQEVIVHEQRLLGAVDWTPQGRAFDAVTTQIRVDGYSADAGFAVLGDIDSGVAATNALLGFLRAGVAPREATQVDALVVFDRDEGLRRTRVTAGVYGQAVAGALSGRLEAYGQLGSADGVALRAGMVGVRGTWTGAGGPRPSVSAWYDLLSGGGDTTASTTFDTLYATNHKFYGLMDIAAFSIGGAADGQGLHDGAVKVGLKPADGVGLNLDVHVLAPAAPAGDATIFGEEADLWASGRLTGKLTLSGGASAFLWAESGRGLDAWTWVQLGAEL